MMVGKSLTASPRSWSLDEVGGKSTKLFSTAHDLNVLQVERDGTSQEAVDQLPVVLVIMEVVVVVLSPSPEHRCVHCLDSLLAQLGDVFAHFTVVGWRQRVVSMASVPDNLD